MDQSGEKCRRESGRKSSCYKCSLTFLPVVLILLNGLIYSQLFCMLARADDSAAAPAFDMGALASLASNLGSNPQIMSLVSNFLNPNQPKPSVGSASALNSAAQSDLSGASDLEPNAIDRQMPVTEPLRRGMRTTSDQQQQQIQAASVPATATTSTTNGASQQQTSANPLNSLMSRLPSIMSGISGAGGGLNLGALSGLLGLGKQHSASTPNVASTASTPLRVGEASISDPSSSASATSSPPAPIAQPQTAQATTSTGASSSSPATAQQVINLVLTSYASGQIPNDLIQLGLSGRVPPQIIELALSGQVPLEMIKMVVTGQVPMSTINAFLNAMQQIQQPQQPAATAQASGSGSSSSTASAPKASQSPGFFSATRSLFEALFNINNRSKDPNHPETSKPGITVPTLIGPIPLKMPSLPNMRSIGQLVGGTITNISSMIPF